MFRRKKKDDATDAGAGPEKKKSWFRRLADGLTKSKDKITSGIDEVIARAPAEEPPAGQAPAAQDVVQPEPPAAPPPGPAEPKPARPEPVRAKTKSAKAAASDKKGAAPDKKAAPDRETPREAKESAAESAPKPEPPSTRIPEPEPEQKIAQTKETARPGLVQRITQYVTRRKLDDRALEEIEEVLIMADLGPSAAAKLTSDLATNKFDKSVSSEEVREALAANIARILEPVAVPLQIDGSRKPHVVLVTGVNGSGKTTTIGKLARQYVDDGLSVTMAAGDTFRAAAIEQLQIWGERTGCPVIAGAPGADAAGLAFDALAEARRRSDDVLLIDTAGRLQNKKELMAELEKIVRVLRKQDETAPHTVLLVLDATVGQNAHSQVEVFRELADVSGLVVTKLDGTARGGVVVALAEKFGLPVHAIGVGETADDLRAFNAEDFARSLMGLAD